MSSTKQSKTALPVALLSAATVADDKIPATGALTIAGGELILAHQIASLRHAGVTRFLIEVDTVPGALIALADKIRLSGCSIDFVRSAQDLQQKLTLEDGLLVHAEGVLIAAGLLSSVLDQPGSFIATIDGRDENNAFERMDLNTRWAGLAFYNKQTVAALGSLPEGWNISSSLLRQAMQDRVSQRPLKQSHIQQGDLRKISSLAETEILTEHILSSRIAREPGFIEAQIFGPVAVRIVPFVWRSSSGTVLLNSAMLLIAATSLGFAALGWPGASVIAALLAIFLNSIRTVERDQGLDSDVTRWAGPAMWLLLVAALFIAARSLADPSESSLFGSVMMTGLAVLARQLRLPKWAEKSLVSPALLAIVMLLLTPLFGVSEATKWISMAQLAMLVAAKWSHKPKL